MTMRSLKKDGNLKLLHNLHELKAILEDIDEFTPAVTEHEM